MTAPPPLPLPLPLAGRRVLLADDVEADRYIYRTLLERAGADVTTADDARAALSAAGRGRLFDAVVLDLYMPGMRGTEAAAALRAGGYRGAILGLTAFATGELGDLWRAAGCDDVLPKGDRSLGAVVAAVAEGCDARRGGRDDGG